GAPQMRAIHGEHLKPLTLDVAHPTGDLRRRAVPRDANRILVRGQTCFAHRKPADRTQWDPRLAVDVSAGRAGEESDDGKADERRPEHVEGDAEPEQEASARWR